MSILEVPSVADIVKVFKKTFEPSQVMTFPLHVEVEGAVWDHVVAVTVHDVSTTVLLKSDGFHVEFREGMRAETKTCGLSVKSMIEYVVDGNIRFLSRQISVRKTSVASLRLHESLLVKTLS